MTALSITFHTTPEHIKEWDLYYAETLSLMAKNLLDAEKYLLSEVETDFISDGKNTNLFLVFESAEKRGEFLESEFKNIEERITQKFGAAVMIFVTTLNTIDHRF